MNKDVHAPTEECMAWAAMFDVDVIEPNNGSKWVVLEKVRSGEVYQRTVQFNDLRAWKAAIKDILDL